jgi:UPF0755 protein
VEENRAPGVSSIQGRQWLRKWWVWVLGVLVVLCLVVLALGMWAYSQLQPPTGKTDTAAFTVTSGESVRQIAQDLQQVGLIRNAFLFRVYTSYHHSGSLQAGHYEIQRGTGVAEILQVLGSGKVVAPVISVTIPEGYSVQQIAQRLQDKHVCSKTDFLKAEQNDAFDEAFLTQLKPNPHVKFRLEGYLFPDTYQFKPGTSAHDVINEMLQNFETRVNAQAMKQLQASGKTLPVIITEASMIEKEARVDSERPIIASVIVNRLKIQMKLQMDCTLQYILGHQEIVTTTDTKVVDPYNTYLYPGLPPGPIANPGMASILAAISPAKTDYLYYVVKNDGTGTDFFAKTYAEQLHNEQLSEANLKAHSH